MNRAQVSCPRAWDVCIPFIDFCQASLIQVCLFLFSSRHTYRYLVQPKNHLLGLGYSSVEEYLPNICKALGLIPYSGNGAWRGVMSSYLKDNKAKRTIFFLYLVFVFKLCFSLLQRNDIAMAITKFDQFDFLIDIVPRDELKPPKRQVSREGMPSCWLQSLGTLLLRAPPTLPRHLLFLFLLSSPDHPQHFLLLIYGCF